MYPRFKKLLLAIIIVIPISSFCLAIGQAQTLRLGLNPGSRVSISAGQSLQGTQFQSGYPSVIIFYRMIPCDACNSYFEVAETWRQRYPNLQTIIVSPRSDINLLNELITANGIVVPIFPDVDETWMKSLDVNIQSVFFLVDDSGVVRAKMIGIDPGRWVGFDTILQWANDGDWERVDEESLRPLIVGREPKPLSGANLSQDQPTVVYHYDARCYICNRLQEDGLAFELNTLALNNPNVQFIIFEPKYPQTPRDTYLNFATTFGSGAVPDSVVDWESDEPLQLTGFTLVQNLPNVRVIGYESGSSSDPGMVWGQIGLPGLMLFDRNGNFAGPAPYWNGPFNVGSFRNTVEAFLETQ